MMDKENSNCFTCNTPSCKLSILGKSNRDKITSNSVSMEVTSGEVLFRQGAPLNSIVHLKQGLVKLYIEHRNKSNLIMNIHKTGSIMGIRSALTNSGYKYSAVTLKDSVICFINPEIFIESLKSNNNFSFEILKMVSEESLSLDEKLQMHMQSLLPGKIANTLLHLSNNIYESNQFKLPFTITEFAQLIGASRERVSKVLSELKKDQIINLKSKDMTILNSEMLYSLSQLG